MAGHGSYSKTYTEDFNTAISKGKTRSEALTYASEQRDLRIENKKKREEGYGVNYDDRGGLPKKLRYPFVLYGTIIYTMVYNMVYTMGLNPALVPLGLWPFC